MPLHDISGARIGVMMERWLWSELVSWGIRRIDSLLLEKPQVRKGCIFALDLMDMVRGLEMRVGCRDADCPRNGTYVESCGGDRTNRSWKEEGS